MSIACSFPQSLKMQFDSTDDLAREIVRLRLATDEQIEQARERFHISSDPKSLLKALESQGVLTNYQAQKLDDAEKSPIVLGDYKLMYQNASGSFARVFRACRISNGEMIGVKVLRQRHAVDPTSVAYFRREAEMCQKLKHKNIVPIYEIGMDDGFHYFTMEFIEGGNLRDILKIRGKLSPEETLRLGLDMAEGLEYAISLGMTHRDFKLTNVLMSSAGIAKLVDFGLAGNDQSGEETAVHAVEYATLEKGTDSPRNDPRSDLYFLGGVLYELITGVPPYAPSKSIEDRKRFSRYSGVRPVRAINPSIPVRVAEIIDRLMRVNPYERHQSASEAVKDLRSAVAEFGGDKRQAAVKAPAALQTILCLEHRPQRQDMLREYFTKHDYRLLMLSQWDRALARLKSNPPDSVLIIGDALEGDVAAVLDEALLWCGTKNVPCVVILPKSLTNWDGAYFLKKNQRALTQPVTLRDIRTAIVEARDATV